MGRDTATLPISRDTATTPLDQNLESVGAEREEDLDDTIPEPEIV